MNRLTRFALLPMLVAVGAITMGAAATEARFQDLGHKMMCVCGCSEILLECNHMGCPDSSRMIAELHSAIDKGGNDDAILSAFQDEYGPTVLAAPMLSRFNIVAWVVPPALLLLGLGGTFLLVKKWRLRAAPMPAVDDDAAANDLRERIRKETEV